MSKRIRNLGFSLVELIVAFAVLGVATLGIGSLFVVGTRSASATQERSGIYNEAQLASNQIENMIQKAELGLSYRCGDTFVLQDVASASEKVLYIFNVSDAGQLELLLLKWSADTNEVQYAELTDVSKENVKDIDIPEASASDWALLAEDVKTFALKLDGKNSKVYLNKTSYTKEQTIAIRNPIVYNPETLAQVTEKITVNVASEITEVKINVSPKILAPGANIQLTKNVYGSGTLPSYSTQWLIAKSSDMTGIVGNSSEEGSTLPFKIDGNDVVSVDMTDEIKAHTGSFYVQAIVTETDENDEDRKVVKSNIEEFKIIQDLVVSVEDGPSSSLTSPLATSYRVTNGLEYQMNAAIQGSSLSVYEQKVVWSIQDCSAGVDVSIAQDGMLKVANYSYGGSFNVVATLAKNATVKVVFPCSVVGTHQQNDSLELLPTTGTYFVNRGGEIGFDVKLNGNVIDSEDCNWTASILYYDIDGVAHTVSSDSVIVGNSGIVTVKENLLYERSYNINVTSTLKKDNQIKGEYTLVVPSVSVQIEQPTALELHRGESLELKCNVVGVEHYQLNWTMSRSLRPTYFFGALGNTSVTGSKRGDGNYGVVVLGSDEPVELTEVTVKVSLAGSEFYQNSIVFDTKAAWSIKLTQEDSTIPIDGTGTIKRGTKITLFGKKYEYPNPVNLEYSIENGDSSKISWSVSGKGAEKYIGDSFQVKSSGGGEVLITFTYEGVPELTKTITVTAK